MRSSAPAQLVAFLALLLAPSCLMSRESVNQAIDPATLEQLVPGSSRGADVAAVLGAPSEVVQLGRRSAWRYEFELTKRAGLFLLVVAFQNVDQRSDRVWVFFDEQGVLTHVGSTFEAERARYQMPWQDREDRPETGPQEEAGAQPVEESAQE